MTDSIVVHTKDDHGYSYVEVSDSWAKTCSNLPCFASLWWPNYTTKVIEEKIDGHDVVIQLWLGLCEKFGVIPGITEHFPGGYGAEVGIYRRIPGRTPPKTYPYAMGGPLIGALDLWWPYPELKTALTLELTNPDTNKPFISAGPKTTYWLTKWMDPDSYATYKASQHGNVPWAANYQMRFTINGKTYKWT